MDRENKTRRKLLKSLVVGTGITLAGCSGGDGGAGDGTTTEEDGGGDTDTEGSGTETGGTTTEVFTDTPTEADTTTVEESQLEDHLRVALPTDPTVGVWEVYGGVTPYYTNIMEPLIWVGNDLSLKPWLATDWESTGDKTWEFTIREGVKFHNGETMNAEHVAWSFNQYLNEWSWATGWFHTEPGDVTALDDRTVRFKTMDKFPSLPGTIAHNMLAVQHPDRNREEKEVIGTGPYRVTNREKGQRVETQRFEDYWREPAVTKNLTFRVIKDPTTRALSLENDEVDVIWSPPTSKIESLNKNDKTDTIKRTSQGAMYVGLHNYKAPTDDVKLRKALNWVTSQPTLVDTIFNGVGKPARGPIAKSVYWSAHEKLNQYKQDKEKAKSLVEESSYDGQTLKFLVSNETTDGKTVASALQQWYNEIGVDVSIQQMEAAAFDEAVRNGKGHLVLEQSSNNSGAADYLIYETFHSKGDVNERLFQENNTGLYNPGGKVDTLIQEGFEAEDKEVKEQKYEKALQIIVNEEASVVPIRYQEYVVGKRTDIKNIDLRPVNQMVRWTDTKHLK